jgi:hypothetical protein
MTLLSIRLAYFSQLGATGPDHRRDRPGDVYDAADRRGNARRAGRQSRGRSAAAGVSSMRQVGGSLAIAIGRRAD